MAPGSRQDESSAQNGHEETPNQQTGLGAQGQAAACAAWARPQG